MRQAGIDPARVLCDPAGDAIAEVTVSQPTILSTSCVLSFEIKSVKELMQEWTEGINGRPALASYEGCGKTWRNKASGICNHMSERRWIYAAVDIFVAGGATLDVAMENVQNIIDKSQYKNKAIRQSHKAVKEYLLTHYKDKAKTPIEEISVLAA